MKAVGIQNLPNKLEQWINDFEKCGCGGAYGHYDFESTYNDLKNEIVGGSLTLVDCECGVLMLEHHAIPYHTGECITAVNPRGDCCWESARTLARVRDVKMVATQTYTQSGYDTVIKRTNEN